MNKKTQLMSSEEFVDKIEKADDSDYVLRLYVHGLTPRSLLAIQSIKSLCEEYLKGRYDLDVIDISQQRALAQGEQIIATPTLLKKIPAPLRRLVGDFSDKEKVLLGLDLLPKIKPE